MAAAQLEDWRVGTPEGVRTWQAEDRAHALEQHKDAFPDEYPAWTIGPAQEAALSDLCAGYNVEYRAEHYRPTFDLPKTWVAGWIGGPGIQPNHPTIYVGCDPEGRISS